MNVEPNSVMLFLFGLYAVGWIAKAIMDDNKNEKELKIKKLEQDASNNLHHAKTKITFLEVSNTSLAERNEEYLDIIKNNIQIQADTIKHLSKALKKDVVKVDNDNSSIVGDANRMNAGG